MRTFTDTMGSSIFGIPKSVLCAFIANTASAALIFVPSIVKLTFCAAITILQDLKVIDHCRRKKNNRSRIHSSTDLNFAPSRERKLCFGDSASMSSDAGGRSEEHTSELQSLRHLVCRLLLEKKK